MSEPRIARIASAVAAADIDALLVGGSADLRWLTGFSGSSGLVVVGPGLAVFVTDSRYAEQAEVLSGDGLEVVVADGDLLESACSSLSGSGSLGFDPAQVTVKSSAALVSALPDGWQAVEVANPVVEARLVKDHDEIDAIAEATRLADEALGQVLGRGLAGRTEADVAWDIERTIRELGGEGVSFPPIVASGAHGALPHASPRNVEIPRDTLVVVDWGAQLDGYCSDCTRTLSTGTLAEDQIEVHGIVLEAQQAALDALRAGPTGKEIDSLARSVIEQAGHGERFGHGLGHGVGLEIHEGPTLGKRRSDRSLAAGMVVTVEPGIYLPGRFGVRIEELCVVGEDRSRILTTHPRGIVEVGG